MTYTRTATSTKTFDRIELLKLQVAIALRRASIPESTVDKIRRGVDRQWIDRVVVYGRDGHERAWCSLTLHIDWNKHQLHLDAGRATVVIDDRWTSDTAVELDEALRLFQGFVDERR